MRFILPGEKCPKTGIWVPSNNPNFYPSDYSNRVMMRNFKEGEIMPPTPHGEPSWAFQEEGRKIENFSGLSPEEIMKKVNSINQSDKERSAKN